MIGFPLFKGKKNEKYQSGKTGIYTYPQKNVDNL